MKRKILGMALAIAALTAVGVIRNVSKREQKNDPPIERQGSFKQRLQRAKTEGDKKIRSGAVIPLYAQVDLDTALDIYDLVIGEFVSSKSFATDDDGSVVTWYRFRVTETLSQAGKQRVSKIGSAPAELYPVASDEILIWKTGGTATLDGIEIEMEEVGFPPFDPSKKYLLILAVDPAKQASHVEVGIIGALIVKTDDTLEPIHKQATYFKTQIQNRYGNSVSKLGAKLK